MQIRSRHLYPALIAAFINIAGCSSTRPTFQPASSPTITTSQATSPRKSFHHQSLGASLDQALSGSPQVIAAGEIHKTKKSPLVSTLSRFADEALPRLEKRGYKDYVVELLPSGQIAQAEIEAYKHTGSLGLLLSRWIIGHEDQCGIMKVLEFARLNPSVKLYGSNFADIREFYASSKEKRAETINANNRTLILELLSQGKRIVSYTGAQHNNTNPLPGEESRSFGQEISQQIGAANYREIDIYLPELMKSVSDTDLQIDNRETMIPASGANLFVLGNRSIIIIR